ncbi:CcdB family protein [Undibacterium fentianense]|uniref:Toxin CcdB n=1 Tax=Undibacterium fentianense TaxID=2828728 RepID=A0A941IFP3_9BURK|nr:CcdB family protein [Undibacterium fentianense]
MAQFCVYHNRNTQSKKTCPYLLEMQSNLSQDLATTVVVPLVKFEKTKPKFSRDSRRFFHSINKTLSC